ncbi:hypothetical protein ACFRAE_10560 [Sphingobacterium sp. HJSM2_6]
MFEGDPEEIPTIDVLFNQKSRNEDDSGKGNENALLIYNMEQGIQ